MTRIVAGRAKGRRLEVPARGTRPTSERAREALFNTLRSHLDITTARVLDLYAGSGAVGLEALSRGAPAVTLVEADRAAAEVIGRNIAAMGLPGVQLCREPVARFLDGPASDPPYDLAFADPPYELAGEELAAMLAALAESGWLADSALVVVERPSRAAPPRWPAGIALVTSRRYGDGVLWYGRAHDGR